MIPFIVGALATSFMQSWVDADTSWPGGNGSAFSFFVVAGFVAAVLLSIAYGFLKATWRDRRR